MNAFISQQLTSMKKDLLAHAARWHVAAALAMLLISILPAISMAKCPGDEQTDEIDTPSVSVDETDPVSPPPEQPTLVAKPEVATEEVAAENIDEVIIEPEPRKITQPTKWWFEVSDEQLSVAETRAKEAEAELLRAQTVLEELRFQRRVGELHAKLLNTEEVLAAMFTSAMAAANEQAATDAEGVDENTLLLQELDALSTVKEEPKTTDVAPAADKEIDESESN